VYEQVDYAAVGIENALVGRSGRLSSHRPTSARENVCNNSELLKVSTSKSPTSDIFAQKCRRSVHIHKKLCNLELCVINVYKSSYTLN